MASLLPQASKGGWKPRHPVLSPEVLILRLSLRPIYHCHRFPNDLALTCPIYCPILQGCPISHQSQPLRMRIPSLPQPFWVTFLVFSGQQKLLSRSRYSHKSPCFFLQSLPCVLSLSCPASGSHQCTLGFSTVAQMTFQKFPATSVSYKDARLEYQTCVPLSTFRPAS